MTSCVRYVLRNVSGTNTCLRAKRSSLVVSSLDFRRRSSNSKESTHRRERHGRTTISFLLAAIFKYRVSLVCASHSQNHVQYGVENDRSMLFRIVRQHFQKRKGVERKRAMLCTRSNFWRGFDLGNCGSIRRCMSVSRGSTRLAESLSIVVHVSRASSKTSTIALFERCNTEEREFARVCDVIAIDRGEKKRISLCSQRSAF